MADLQSPKDALALRNGYEIPCIGFGTYKLPNNEQGIEAIHQALSDGYRHFDTASVYENEEALGKALATGTVHREELFVTTKVWNTQRGYDQTLKAFKASQEKLKLDYLDLYLIHWPAGSQVTGADEINADTWRALETLYLDGLVRAIGVSNFKRPHLIPLMDSAEIFPMVNQIELHPGCNQEETRQFCKLNDILVEAWSPLGSGRVLHDDRLVQIAAHYGCTTAQLCVRWCLQRHAVPLPKSSDAGRIAQNARVFWFSISSDDLKLIDELDPLGQSGLDPDTIDF